MSASEADSPSIPPTDARLRSKTQRAFHRGEVHELRGWRRVAFYPLYWLLRLYYASLRFHYAPGTAEKVAALGRPAVFMTWHNRSLLMPPALILFPPLRSMGILISASKMAAWEAEIFRRMGLLPIRGSSTRRAIASTREMLKAHAAGHPLGVSPDGPAGPLYSVQKGVVMLARKTGAPIGLILCNCRHAFRLPTWDRHLVPWPFARVEVIIEIVGAYDALGVGVDDDAVAALLREKLLALTRDPFTLPAE